MNQWICLGVGSMLGGFGRWALTEAMQRGVPPRFPVGTLAVNLSGCLLIGVLYGLGETRLSPQARIFLMTGFCGAYTTFSTWMLECSTMMDGGNWRGALAYASASVLVGFFLFRAGKWLAAAQS